MNTKCDKEQFIKKSKELYGKDSFDYSLVDYVNGYTEITLICKEHGEFNITPTKHLNIVYGCPNCSKERRTKRKMMTTDEYKKLVIQKHGDKYDLSTVEYKGMREYVTAICPIHGNFEIVAYDFVHKRGCPKCGIIQRNSTIKKEVKRGKKLTTEEFIQKSQEIFGDRYIYDKTDLSKKDEKRRVCIGCRIHGYFWQNPYSHLHGHGCEKCGKKEMAKTQSFTTEDFIEKARQIHGDKYDYSETVYTKSNGNVTIKCPIHGNFTQVAYSHLDGHGCKMCANEQNNKLLLSNTAEFIEKAKKIHDNESNDYTLVDYKGAKIPVTIICPKGHVYSQMPNKHLNGHGCPYCVNNSSRAEEEILSYIKSLGFEPTTHNRKMLNNAQELDIYIPSKNIAIEYDGLYWHNETKRPNKKFHLHKTNECMERGIRLIHIFEDEWTFKKDIVKSRLTSIFGCCNNRIYARQCEIKEVDNNTCRTFLDENHIQGSASSSIRYGLYYDNELVSVMTFCKPRKNLGQKAKNNEYELLRFCSKLNTIVVGGASKLFTYFIRQNNPDAIISYADRRWNNGNVYENIGFTFSHFSEPNYFYVIGQHRYNRFSFRKDILVKQGFDPNKSEHEIMMERGIYRIYDCGTAVYKWFKKN